MSKYILICILTPAFAFSQFTFFEFGETHIGIEWNMFWGMGDCELIVADWENHAQDNIHEVEDDFFNSDFSLQYSITPKLVARYTYIKINKNIPGPIGPNLGYKYGDRYSAEYDWEETKYEYYNESGSQSITRIYSIGYPFTIHEVPANPFWGLKKPFPIDIVVFIGLAMNEYSEMDMYLRTEGFSDWYFMDEHDWYIENRETSNSTDIVFGVSIPALIQASIMYTGRDFRLMFGVGI